MRTNTTNAILQYVPGRFERVASTHGGEWAGPCPWCEGTDRFRIWPYRDPYEVVYWCRQCGKHGDVIQFLREQEGLSFREACERAGLSGKGRGKGDADDLLRPRTSVGRDEKQLSIVAAIEVVRPLMRTALRDPLPSAYLSFRGIPQELAEREGSLYLPMPRSGEAREKLGAELLPWCGRMIFPTRSPQGSGYVGRCLRGWKPDMAEAEHKALLERHRVPRYLTTGGGWSWQEQAGVQTGVVILVEGVFDRLALLAAGLPAEEVIAVGSDSGNPDWLPMAVQSVVCAFDADTADRGRKATAHFLTRLRLGGVHVVTCLPLEDGRGKDASERWRRAGYDGIEAMVAAWSAEVSRLAEARTRERQVQKNAARGQLRAQLSTLQLTPASFSLLADPQPPLPEEMAAAPACERCGCTEWYMRVDGTWLRRCYFEMEGTTGNLASEALAKGI